MWILLPALTLITVTSYKTVLPAVVPVLPTIDMYALMNLQEAGLNRTAFDEAMAGFELLRGNGSLTNDSILSIIDFSHASGDKRLFVLNMQSLQILFKTYVSHGRNSGLETANTFSNEPNSLKSSLGFYITGDIYKGKHGSSLRLDGQEPGINDNALSRGIVMHSADYVNENLAESRGYIGRSQGCPAIPSGMLKVVINKIKNGSCLFIYGSDKKYATASPLLSHRFVKIQA